MALDMTMTKTADATVVILTGELDISEAPRVERELEAIQNERPRCVVIDLRNLTFMDSSGLRLIISAYQRLDAAGAKLQLIPGPDAIQRIFSVTRLDERLEFVEPPVH